jgi:hypothetical protein
VNAGTHQQGGGIHHSDEVLSLRMREGAMALFSFQTITLAEAAAYNAAADSLAFGAGSATQLSVGYLAAPEQVAITLGGLTVNFGTGIYGDLDLSFDNGGRLFVGGPGGDNAAGGASDDALFGGLSTDALNGGEGSDVLQGNQGDDSLAGGPGDDTIYGGQDRDVIVLGSGAGEFNWANGNKGDDTITGADGVDIIRGGQNNDSLAGGEGGDFLNGNLGDDIIRGGSGADTILGEGGYDIMSGGGGADTYVFGAGSSEVDLALADRILDWSGLERVVLPVQGGYAEVASSMPPPPPDPYGYDYGYGMGGGYGYAPTLSDFSTALSSANMAMAGNPSLQIVGTQADSDVVVFVDTNADHTADLAIILVGKDLGMVDALNFI